jgi:hypothetical protein
VIQRSQRPSEKATVFLCVHCYLWYDVFKENRENKVDEETEHAKKFFHDEGWSDYVKSEDKELSLESLLAAEALWDQPQSVIERWYIDGWNEARATEQKMGRPVFTLVELRKRMKEAIEWYGEDFDAPIAMITSVLRKLGYNEDDVQQRNPSLPDETSPLVVELSRKFRNPDHISISAHAFEPVTFVYATLADAYVLQEEKNDDIPTPP